MVAAAGRPVRFLAKAPLFTHPRVGWLVRASGAIPVYRRVDDASLAYRNQEMFAAVFEALSHPRTYRSPFTALQALERVVGMQDEYFSPQVVSALVNEISAFPLDSYVQISSGEIGRVVATDPGNILRPKVELVWDADWKRIQGSDTLDLATRPDLTVARALLDSELPIT